MGSRSAGRTLIRIARLAPPLALLCQERASEKLNYQYRLTLDEIRAAHEKLHIPLEVLVKDYPLKKTG